jgi:uncharacterized SAM-binding protein YcdF (DUF218 family)
VSDFGWYFVSAGGAIVSLAAAALWVALSRGSAASRRVLALVVLLYWIAGAYMVPDTIRTWMASPYHPLQRADVPAGRVGIVLLGSGSAQFRDWSENKLAVVDPIAASRVLEAARVFRLLGADYIISSGGLITQSERLRPSGITMAETLQHLGVPKDRILLEAQSKTTRDEAVIVKEMLAEHRVDHVVLVTSQFHMRRSVGAFKAVGIDVIPAIAREPESLDTWWQTVIPTDKGLEESSLAAHELGGILVYRLRGWFAF